MQTNSQRGSTGSIGSFWQRVSDGIEIQQLWPQFQKEARASYQLYSKEVNWQRAQGESRWRRFWRVTTAMFWAMVMKLSPTRRVLFLIALVLLVLNGPDFHYNKIEIQFPNLAFWGGIALLILLALELADRVTMKRDLEIAKDIQSWLMPSAPPQVPGVDMAFATRAANTVAGDYYDAFLRSAAPEEHKDRLLLIVADVAGKSVPAALLMATLQASLRTLSVQPISPIELIRRLNRYACEQNLGRQRFTTAFLAELELATGLLTYVNAGHNWPVLRRSSGAIERMETGGLPLGIMSGAHYECGQTTMKPGDLLLVFTDGLIEAENDKEEEYGEARMLGTAFSFPGGSAADLIRRLMTSVEGFVGSAPQHDDITCLVVRMGSPSNMAA
jgi:sigma-B regulation protein RsbU (phosphoserine phosphatase)